MKDLVSKLARVTGVKLCKGGLLVDAAKAIDVLELLDSEQLADNFQTKWETRGDKLYLPLLDEVQELDYSELVEEEYYEEVEDKFTDLVRGVVHSVLMKYSEEEYSPELREKLEGELTEVIVNMIEPP